MRRAVRWSLAVAGALAVPLVLRLWAEPVRVASLSMEPTVRQGDHVLVVKRPRPRGSRGEVVAFRRGEAAWVKRVAALPGDRVEIAGGRVRVNGALVEPPPDSVLHLRAVGAASLADVWACDVALAGRQEGGAVVVEASEAARRCLVARGLDVTPAAAPQRVVRDTAYVVAEGHLVVLGDHPARSDDSRAFGPIREDQVIGRVDRVLVSFNEATGAWRAARTGRTVH